MTKKKQADINKENIKRINDHFNKTEKAIQFAMECLLDISEIYLDADCDTKINFSRFDSIDNLLCATGTTVVTLKEDIERSFIINKHSPTN